MKVFKISYLGEDSSPIWYPSSASGLSGPPIPFLWIVSTMSLFVCDSCGWSYSEKNLISNTQFSAIFSNSWTRKSAKWFIKNRWKWATRIPNFYIPGWYICNNFQLVKLARVMCPSFGHSVQNSEIYLSSSNTNYLNRKIYFSRICQFWNYFAFRMMIS